MVFPLDFMPYFLKAVMDGDIINISHLQEDLLIFNSALNFETGCLVLELQLKLVNLGKFGFSQLNDIIKCFKLIRISYHIKP